MLNALVPYVLRLRGRWPRVYQFFVNIGKRYLGERLGVFPRPLANEISAVTAVLRGSQWNMAYGVGLEHERLEAAFAEYLGGGYAVAVNTGGMALQMAMRGLGLKPGDEVVHQIDTCSATAMAVMNAGCTPIFADISNSTFMLDVDRATDAIGTSTKAVIATHMWGNVEDTTALLRLKESHSLVVIEDACLALGARCNGRSVGSLADAGVFSFGCLKPVQAGEGGMIFTHDESLARELRAMRHWGDRTLEFGTRDAVQLAWNGRMSEIIAAVVREQLRGYPAHLRRLRDSVAVFEQFVRGIDGLSLVVGAADTAADASFTQVVLRLDERKFGWRKNALMSELYRRGIQVRHANFELINSLTFFKHGNWSDWIYLADRARVARNYGRQYPQAQLVFDEQGLGLGNVNFLSSGNLRNLMRQIHLLALKRP